MRDDDFIVIIIIILLSLVCSSSSLYLHPQLSYIYITFLSSMKSSHRGTGSYMVTYYNAGSGVVCSCEIIVIMLWLLDYNYSHAPIYLWTKTGLQYNGIKTDNK